MRCPYCGAPLTKKKYCDGCKEDVTLYKNALRSSNIYYNLGLEQARVRDLSNAIINLFFIILSFLVAKNFTELY